MSESNLLICNESPVVWVLFTESNPTLFSIVDNIPDELDHLVVATGVGVQLMGILIGLKKYNKKV